MMIYNKTKLHDKLFILTFHREKNSADKWPHKVGFKNRYSIYNQHLKVGGGGPKKVEWSVFILLVMRRLYFRGL